MAVTEEDKCTVASKVLTFAVKGMALKWKQAVGYFFVGNSLDENKLWTLVVNIVQRLWNEGISVEGLASDMGPQFQKLWRKLGIHAVDGSTRNFVRHPADPNKKLYSTADIAHVLKNAWITLTEPDFYLFPELAEEHPEWRGHLRVSVRHVARLIELQEQPEDRGITLQYKLVRHHIRPVLLEKMRVRFAAEFFSRSTATALEFCAQRDDIPEIDHTALPTAWLLREFDKWFDIANDRKRGIDGDHSGEQKIAQLEDFKELVRLLKFGRAGWKCIQTGIILASTTIISVHHDLVRNGNFRYLLPGRLTTDSLENLFSQVRQVMTNHPGPVEVRRALRLVSVGQFFFVPKSSSYARANVDEENNDEDDEYIVNFLSGRRREEIETDIIGEEAFAEPELLTVLQQQGVYKTAGWVAKEVASHACMECVELLTSEEPLEDDSSEWTTMLSRGGLTHPSQAVLKLVKIAETVFNSLKLTLLQCHNVKGTFIEQASEHVDADLSEELHTECQHNLVNAILAKFIDFRVHVYAYDLTRKIPREIDYAGRACFMATVANARRIR